jgi:DNA-binding NarL/FixJ family response regulator
MTDNLNAVISDGLTGEIITRELTAEESLALSESIQEAENELTTQAAKIASRESALAKLAALGLTEDEIAAL